MRIAVPVSDGRLAAHFGHCEQFALIDVDQTRKEITGKEFAIPPQHEPGVLPVWLAEQGVSVVIAGGMGSRAQNLFQQNRIHVVIGAPEADPERVVLDYLSGCLAVGDNVCDH
jgi:ATP-binding protein involved in chromosome partitioning